MESGEWRGKEKKLIHTPSSLVLLEDYQYPNNPSMPTTHDEYIPILKY